MSATHLYANEQNELERDGLLWKRSNPTKFDHAKNSCALLKKNPSLCPKILCINSYERKMVHDLAEKIGILHLTITDHARLFSRAVVGDEKRTVILRHYLNCKCNSDCYCMETRHVKIQAINEMVAQASQKKDTYVQLVNVKNAHAIKEIYQVTKFPDTLSILVLQYCV